MASEDQAQQGKAPPAQDPPANDEPDKDQQELLDTLDAEDRELTKDTEINRIMQACRLDAYAVMDLLPGVPEADIKAVYRKKSLRIHPDKTRNPQAPEAFDRLAKAQTLLLDDAARGVLDELIADARTLLLRERKLSVDSPQLHTDEWKAAWRHKCKEVIVDDELRRRRQRAAHLREEGRQQRLEEQEVAERKRKREHQSAWEETRDARVDSWRDWQKKGGAQGAAAKAAESKAKKKKKRPKLG